MDKNVLAVFDTNEEYVTKLMNYLMECRSVPLEIQGFTDKSCLRDYVRENQLDILLIPEEQIDEELEAVNTGETMILSEDDTVHDNKGRRTIFRYQSSENIMREVMSYYADRPETEFVTNNSTSTKLIGIYSPVGRCFRTSFALALGQVLAERSKVLYVNLEEYSGFNQLLQQNFMSDISDLLFYVGQKKRNFPCKLASMVQKLGNMDFIPPVISPLDIRAVDRESWFVFFNEIMKCDYDHVIVDFGDTVDGFLELLQGCSRIYTPVREGTVSDAKVEQYEAMLRILEKDSILEKTLKLRIPYFSSLSCTPQYLGRSELGEYARKLVGGDAA